MLSLRMARDVLMRSCLKNRKVEGVRSLTRANGEDIEVTSVGSMVP